MLINYTDFYCIRFAFGVPLEDIFPPNDIHPKLKNLLQQAYLAVGRENLGARDILNNDHGPERCEQLSNENYSKAKTLLGKVTESADTYFWLIRYFLGQLPIALFPKYANGRRFNWGELALLARINLRHRYSRISSLEFEIYKNIMRLPKAHIMLIDYLFTFFRKLSQIFENSDKVDRKTMVAITKYFTSSLFMRPFRLGSTTAKNDKKFYFLTYYLIFNLNQILPSRIVTTHKDRFYYQLNYMPEDYSHVSTKRRVKDVACQTQLVDDSEDVDWKSCDIDLDESPSYTEDVLVQCSTPDLAKTLKTGQPSIGELSKLSMEPSHYETVNHEAVGYDLSRHELASYVTVSQNSKPRQSAEALQKTNSELLPPTKTNPNDQELEDFLKGELSKTILTPIITNDGDGYLYDDYDTFRSESFNQIAINDSTKYYSILDSPSGSASIDCDTDTVCASTVRKNLDISLSKVQQCLGKLLMRTGRKLSESKKSSFVKSKSCSSLKYFLPKKTDSGKVGGGFSKTPSRSILAILSRYGSSNIKYKKLLTL